MSIVKAIDQTVIAGVFLACLGGAAYLTAVAAVKVVPPVMTSWSSNWARLEANEARGERIRVASQEDVFEEVCPAYFEQDFFGRHVRYRDVRWCENYRDRM